MSKWLKNKPIKKKKKDRFCFSQLESPAVCMTQVTHRWYNFRSEGHVILKCCLLLPLRILKFRPNVGAADKLNASAFR